MCYQGVDFKKVNSKKTRNVLPRGFKRVDSKTTKNDYPIIENK